MYRLNFKDIILYGRGLAPWTIDNTVQVLEILKRYFDRNPSRHGLFMLIRTPDGRSMTIKMASVTRVYDDFQFSRLEQAPSDHDDYVQVSFYIEDVISDQQMIQVDTDWRAWMNTKRPRALLDPGREIKFPVGDAVLIVEAMGLSSHVGTECSYSQLLDAYQSLIDRLAELMPDNQACVFLSTVYDWEGNPRVGIRLLKDPVHRLQAQTIQDITTA